MDGPRCAAAQRCRIRFVTPRTGVSQTGPSLRISLSYGYRISVIFVHTGYDTVCHIRTQGYKSCRFRIHWICRFIYTFEHSELRLTSVLCACRSHNHPFTHSCISARFIDRRQAFHWGLRRCHLSYHQTFDLHPALSGTWHTRAERSPWP